MQTVDDYNDKFAESELADLRSSLGGLAIHPAEDVTGLDEHQASPTRAYMTISQVSCRWRSSGQGRKLMHQAANEKQAALQKGKETRR
jgi:hypothetical protein